MVLSRNQVGVSLFDIRITSAERDVLVLRGSEDDASSVLLSGIVVLSVNEPTTIKKLSLKLTGTMRLNWYDTVVAVRGPTSKSHKYEKSLYEFEWPNLERSSSGSGTTTPSSFSSSSSASANMTHILPIGNHEFPFEAILPGDLPESIEGLDVAQVVYRMQATIERGRFQSNLFAKKHLRIIRTVGSDSFELSQTVSIDNTWPGKVEYSVSIPSKAVPIGSSAPVLLTMVPLLKGLKLGTIKIQLAETVSLASPVGATHCKESIKAEAIIPAPEGGLDGEDKWEINDFFTIPTSLTKVTQDCQVNQYIKVSHKLKFGVGLINPDGHISELRASLPIYLFISPNVQVTSIDPTSVSIPGSVSSEEEVFPHSNPHSGTITPNGASNTDLRALDGSLIDSIAPPNYEDHIYDRLWGDIPPSTFDSPTVRSPGDSGDSTPFIRSRRNSNDPEVHMGLTSLDPAQRSQLAAGLRALERQQELQQQQAGPNGSHNSGSDSHGSASLNASSPSSSFVLGGHSHNSSDYFSLAHARVASHSNFPEFMHMSRVASPSQSPYMGPSNATTSVTDLVELSKVPSYSTALKSDLNDGNLAPGYEAGSSRSSYISLSQIGENPENMSSSSSFSKTSRLGHRIHPHGSSPNGHESSSGSLSRNASSTGLFKRNHSSRSLLEEATRLMRHK